jgi:hypothetical protein
MNLTNQEGGANQSDTGAPVRLTLSEPADDLSGSAAVGPPEEQQKSPQIGSGGFSRSVPIRAFTISWAKAAHERSTYRIDP